MQDQDTHALFGLLEAYLDGPTLRAIAGDHRMPPDLRAAARAVFTTLVNDMIRQVVDEFGAVYDRVQALNMEQDADRAVEHRIGRWRIAYHAAKYNFYASGWKARWLAPTRILPSETMELTVQGPIRLRPVVPRDPVFMAFWRRVVARIRAHYHVVVIA